MTTTPLSFEVCHYLNCEKQALFRCAKCHKALYCSKTCQDKDWPRHKKTCSLSVSQLVGIRMAYAYVKFARPVRVAERERVMGPHWYMYPDVRLFVMNVGDWSTRLRSIYQGYTAGFREALLRNIHAFPVFFPNVDNRTVIILEETAATETQHENAKLLFSRHRGNIIALREEAQRPGLKISTDDYLEETQEIYKGSPYDIPDAACISCYRTIADINPETRLCPYCTKLRSSLGGILPTKADYDASLVGKETSLPSTSYYPQEREREEEASSSSSSTSPPLPLSEMCSLRSEFLCPLCFANMPFYASVPCGHPICKECYEMLARRNELNICWICRTPLIKFPNPLNPKEQISVVRAYSDILNREEEIERKKQKEK